MEVSSRVTEAENVANIATERLLSSASILDQVVGSCCNDLLAIINLEASLGLAHFKAKDSHGVAGRLPCVKMVVKAFF